MTRELTDLELVALHDLWRAIMGAYPVDQRIYANLMYAESQRLLDQVADVDGQTGTAWSALIMARTANLLEVCADADERLDRQRGTV